MARIPVVGSRRKRSRCQRRSKPTPWARRSRNFRKRTKDPSRPADWATTAAGSCGSGAAIRSYVEAHHNVYVVLLKPEVARYPKVLRQNPKRDPAKPCVYVGMTGLTV